MDTEEIMQSIKDHGTKESSSRDIKTLIAIFVLVAAFGCAIFLSIKNSNVDRHALKRNNVICTQVTYKEHEYLFFRHPKGGVVHSPDCGKCAKKDSFNRGDLVNKQPKKQAQKGETKRYIIMPTVQEKVPVKE